MKKMNFVVDFIQNPFLEVVLVIFLTSVVQSLFGVGILLIGTPTLMFIGYPYFEALGYLLPTSLVISLIQILELKGRFSVAFLKEIIIYTIPLIPFGMFLANRADKFMGVFVGIFLITISIGKFYSKLTTLFVFNKIPKFFNRQLGLMGLGFLHGLTNLGGAILPAFNNTEGLDKNIKLANISVTYIVFVTSQLIYMFLFSPEIFDGIGLILSACVFTGVLGNRLIGKNIYNRIHADRYTVLMKIYVFIIGVFLVIKNLLME